MSLNRAPSRQQQIPNNIFNGVGRRQRHKSSKAKKKQQQDNRATKAERLRVLATQELLASEQRSPLDAHSLEHLQQRPRVAIIGGGAAGLASLRNLVAVSSERFFLLKIADYSRYVFGSVFVMHTF